LDGDTGQELWTVSYPALGQLDYDNAPRATPLLHDDRVYFFGAFGDLVCADARSGEVFWHVNVRLKFLALDRPPWGTCSTPLLVDDMIVVNPGAPAASLAALDAKSGETVWQTPGEPQGYGSFIVATLGGVRQIVGHTQTKLGGWDPQTGREMWSLAPKHQGDFNVPTPIVVGERLLIATENNGGRLYAFDSAGVIRPNPVAVNMALNPQMSTPVSWGARVFCVNRGSLDCFDAANGLTRLGRSRDRAYAEFGALVASRDRLLAQGRGGELLLLDATADRPAIIARAHVAAKKQDRAAELYTFPALVGNQLYVRCESEVIRVDL
ncbi:MAG: PQQ-binding-like beta-propeller repeat protein, partial [Planctomycetota bacterium]